MKIKPRTISAFYKWCESHKMSDTFIWAGQPIKGSAMKKLIEGDSKTVEPKVAEKVVEPVNIDIQEEEYADMGQSLDDRSSEEY